MLMRQIQLVKGIFMNNILVINNTIEEYENEFVVINNNNITFKKNCDYSIYYENCTNININMNILDNVYVKLFEYMSDLEINSNITYNIYDNGTLLLFKFYSNKSVVEKININLLGYMSKVNYNFSNICINEEIYNLTINHNNSNSISNISNKSICIEDGKIEFDIDTIVEKGNTKCKMNQDTKIINFKDNKSVVKPNMYISEEDVEARHASVIGSINEEELFYLMARGINYDNSIKLLVKGYIFSNLIVDMEKRSKILNIINKYWR